VRQHRRQGGHQDHFPSADPVGEHDEQQCQRAGQRERTKRYQCRVHAVLGDIRNHEPDLGTEK
jgi:hypothetical protein